MLGALSAVNYFFAVIVHELGHYFVAKKLGYKLSKFSFSPYGVSLSYYDQNLLIEDETKIAAAGPFANFVSVLFVVALWWIFPTVYFFTESFVYVSVLLALVNLLPAYPLDGGRIFVSLGSKFFEQTKLKRVTIIFNILFSILFFALFVIFCFVNFNPSYLCFAVFLIAGVLDLKQNTKYEKVNIFNKKVKNFSKSEVLCIDSNTTISEILRKININKTVVFCVVLENGKIINLSEKMIIKLSMNYDLNTKLNEIFNI